MNNYKAYGKYLFDTLFDIENKRQANPLPLFASFTTEDIHSNRKLEEKRFKQYFHKPSFGYYECMQGNGFFPYWIKRLLVLTEGNKSIEEIEGVQQAIKKALGEEGCNIITHMSVRPNQGKVYYHFTDGREVEAENLSDGYTRVVNIVTFTPFDQCFIDSLSYSSSNGKIKSSVSEWDREIDKVLNLNNTLLKKSRLEVLDAVIHELKKKISITG